MIRRLRITMSFLCLALSVTFLAWWVDSQDSYLHARGDVPPSHSFRFIQYPGEEIRLQWRWDTRTAFGATWRYVNSEAIVEDIRRRLKAIPYRPHTVLGFHVNHGPGGLLLLMPYWFPVLVAGVLAILLRPKPRLRCGLRELFAITTIVAVVAAGYVLFSQFAVEWPE